MPEEQTTTWREMFDKMMELGLGAALLTKEAASKLVDDMVKRGSVSKEDGKKLFHEMMEKGRLQKERMEEVISETMSHLLEKSDLARRSQIEALEKRIAALESDLHARPQGPPPPPAPV
jgi:polyhydroxyalkanoate synthesis regulator phasin